MSEYKVLKSMQVRDSQGNSTNAYIIDDTRIDEAAWSSKNTVDKLAPAFEESGSIVTFQPVEGYPLTVQTEEGATKVIRCGKNIADIYGFSAQVVSSPEKNRVLSNQYGTTLSTTEASNTLVVTQSSITDNRPTNYANGYFCIGFYHDLKDGDTVSISFDVEITNNLSDNNDITVMPSNKEGTTAIITNGRFKITCNWANNGQSKYFTIRNCGKSMVISNIQIEVGNTATDYEEYQGGEFGVGEPVPALKGINTICADSGEITVTGRADPNAVIADIYEKLNAVLATTAALTGV